MENSSVQMEGGDAQDFKDSNLANKIKQGTSGYFMFNPNVL